MALGDELPAYPTPQQAFHVNNNTKRKQPPPRQQTSHRTQPPQDPRYQSPGQYSGHSQYSAAPTNPQYVPPANQQYNQSPHQYSQSPGHQYVSPAPQQQTVNHPPSSHSSHSPTHQYNQPQPQAYPPQTPTHQQFQEYPSRNFSQTSIAQPAPAPNKQQQLEMELNELFVKCDINKTGKLSELELANALHNFDHTKFQASTVRLMIQLFDKDKNGTIEFAEFIQLWKYISSYKKLFYQADKDGSKSISFSEYQAILSKIGYNLNTDLILFLFQKFSSKGPNPNVNAIPNLKFDSFIESLIYLRKLTDVFKKYDTQTSGVAVINFQDFILEFASLT